MGLRRASNSRRPTHMSVVLRPICEMFRYEGADQSPMTPYTPATPCAGSAEPDFTALMAWRSDHGPRIRRRRGMRAR